MEDEERKKYEKLVERLVFGWRDEKTREHQYFKPGSREEREARHAVARLLRDLAHSQEDHTGLWLIRLATLFDPPITVKQPPGVLKARSRSYRWARDISFNQRREGNPGKRAEHQRIAREMVQMVLADPKQWGAVSRAVESAKRKYGLEEWIAKRIWSDHGKPVLEGKPR
jgi:hypothetical protein